MRLTSLLLAVPALCSVAAAQGPALPGPSFTDIISLRSVGSPAISPDGKAVAYTVTSTDWKDNRYDTEIWLWREGGTSVQLTRTEKGSSTSPKWSPDGQWVAFLADRGDKQQVFLISPRGGEAWPLTAVKEGVQDFEWAPDGTRIAFVRPDPDPEGDKQRKERYGNFAIEDQEFQQNHLWLARVPSAGEAAMPDSQPRRLTEGNFDVADFAWSPDGSKIAIARQRDPLINSSVTSDVWLLDVAGKQLTPFVQQPGPDGSPVWSPDGRSLLYSSSGGDTASYYYQNGQLYAKPLDGGAAVRLAATFDEDPGQVTWNATGLYLVAWQKAKRAVFRIDPANGAVTPFATTPDLIGTVSFSADGKTMAFIGQTAATLAEIYVTALPPSRLTVTAITAFTAQIAGWTLGTSEVVSWKSRDGAIIEGVLHKPQGFDPSRKYPLLVLIHGGPTGVDYPVAVYGSVYPVHQWLAKGALVLRPNYRGSAGYGEAFRSLNVRNLGVGDAWDVLSGVDYMVKQGSVDTTRMAAMGWSQGGYISAFLTTTTTRFKAISVGAGISDWMTYYVNTDIHPFTRQYLKATPWDDPAIYAKTSPITYIKQAKTPTQLQWGEFDRRVPIPNGYELYQGLQDRGVPTRMIVYQGFGHGISKPKERLAAVWHNWQWFAQYLWGEDVQLPLKVETADRADGGVPGRP
jgi:dipeptidyl aminopeptidase/acylaminoacyl peptidase